MKLKMNSHCHNNDHTFHIELTIHAFIQRDFLID